MEIKIKEFTDHLAYNRQLTTKALLSSQRPSYTRLLTPKFFCLIKSKIKFKLYFIFYKSFNKLVKISIKMSF